MGQLGGQSDGESVISGQGWDPIRPNLGGEQPLCN